MNSDPSHNVRLLRAGALALHGESVQAEIDPILQQLAEEIALIMAATVDPTTDLPDSMRGSAEVQA